MVKCGGAEDKLSNAVRWKKIKLNRLQGSSVRTGGWDADGTPIWNESAGKEIPSKAKSLVWEEYL